MKDNVLNLLTVHIINTNEMPTPEPTIKRGLVNVDFLYSYLIYAEYTDNVLTGWDIEFLVSQTTWYNTISVSDAIADIASIIVNAWFETSIKYVIGYKQPPVEILIDAFEPLIKKLAAKQRERWKSLEYEDLCQICRMVICHLYTKGYYLHSKLISKAFTNQVLIELRPERYKQEMIRLDAPIGTDDGHDVFVLDTVVDTQQEESKAEQDFQETLDVIMAKKKELIIEALGGSERQYQQLVREYGNKAASPWARMTVQRIKKYLNKLDIDSKSFDYLKGGN